MTDLEYQHLKSRVLAQTGIDLDSYKSQQMRRRLDGFVATHSTSASDFCKAMERDKALLGKLRDFLTINVSEFFRDGDHFQTLRDVVLPDMLKGRAALNIWSAGCSHGGEPYSVAMILDDLSPGHGHRILATDLDEGVLARARAGGPYTSSEVNNVGRALLLKHFTRDGRGYWVKEHVRRCVEFRQHNLLRDRFESGFDLVICRNVVIYFTDKAKLQLVQGFHQSLRDGGVLFIGATETMLATPEVGFERLFGSLYRKCVPTFRRQVPRGRPSLLGV